MKQIKQLPQIQEILALLQKAKELSLQSLERVEKLNANVTQIQGRNIFIQQCLKEQSQMVQHLKEQNPHLEIFESSKERLHEALTHSFALSQLTDQTLEILDLSATPSHDNLSKASVLLRSVIACLDMIAQEKMQDFIQTTQSNQTAGATNPKTQDLQSLIHHLKGQK